MAAAINIWTFNQLSGAFFAVIVVTLTTSCVGNRNARDEVQMDADDVVNIEMQSDLKDYIGSRVKIRGIAVASKARSYLLWNSGKPSLRIERNWYWPKALEGTPVEVVARLVWHEPTTSPPTFDDGEAHPSPETFTLGYCYLRDVEFRSIDASEIPQEIRK